MSVITKCIRDNKKTDDYLDWPASYELRQNSYNWSKSVRPNIALEADQIRQILILNVDRVKMDG